MKFIMDTVAGEDLLLNDISFFFFLFFGALISVKTTNLKIANTMHVRASRCCDCKILDAALLPSFLYVTYQRPCMNNESAGIWKFLYY